MQRKFSSVSLRERLADGYSKTGGSQGGSCTAALFLKAFAPGIEAEGDEPPKLRWAHVDIAGVMEVSSC